MINHPISLDMRKRPGRVPPRLTMRRGESQTQKITATLTDNGTAYTPTYQSARLCILHADGTWARCAATVSGSIVTATLPSDMLNGAGRCRLAYFEFYSSNGYSETTENIELVILSNVDTTGSEGSKSYSDEMDALYAKWSAYEASAEKAESKRQGEHAAAMQSAASATNAANAAATSANAAAAAARQANETDVAALKAENTKLASMVADLKDGFFVLGGQVFCPASKVSVSGDALTFASTCTASGTTLTFE